MNDPVKEKIGRYELLALVGDGAQGKVFRARCAEAGGPVAPGEAVAIKVLRVPPDDDQVQLRFQAQAEILKRLSHPNIIRCLDSFVWHPGEWDEAQCLVMEFLDGETLASRLATARRGLPWPEVNAIFEPCLAGLMAASRQGIVHRDLKPSNIFLVRDGSVRIFDFEIARVEGAGQRSTVGWKGSFDYMAPDFVTEPDFHGDEKSDIFSLGVCLSQALTGRLPFEPFGENAHIGYLNRWRNAAAPPKLSFHADAYRVLANARSLVSRSLSPRRDGRYPSFAALGEDFQRIRYRVIQHVGRDQYELRALLGRGGFGEVFQGVRQSDGQPVAIKHLFAERQSARFIKEAKILRRYAHPFLVKYLDFIEVRGATQESQYFLVLELLAGMPGACLRHRIKHAGKIEPGEALPLFMNYLEALSFLHGHARPLVHRDLKPMNLYAPEGHPENGKVFDLGVARDVSGTVTSGGIPGTLDYMAPEFALPGADRGTPQSDIYSLGLCLYEALTGQTPFSRLPADINSSWPIFQDRARNRPEIDYSARVFRLYPDLLAVVRKAIALQPGDRYADAAAMRRDLEKVLLRLDRPEEIPAAAEDSATVAAASAVAAPPAQNPSSAAESAPRPAEESADLAPPDFPELDLAGAERPERRRWRIPAAAAILLLAAAAGAAFWWFGLRGAVRPGSAPAVVPPPPEVPATPPVPAASPPAEVQFPSVPAASPAPEEPENVRLARAELEQLARSARIPIADLAYLENLAAALARARRVGEQYPELAGEADKKSQELKRHGADLPALFQSGLEMTLAQDDLSKAASLLAAWRAARRHASLLGLTAEQAEAQANAMEQTLGRYQLDAAAAEIADLLPEQCANAAEVEQAEQAAEALELLEGWRCPGVAAAGIQAKVAALRSMLTAGLQAGISAWRDETVAMYRQGRDGALRHAELESLADAAPAAAALVNADYRQALEAAESARAQWAILVGKKQRMLKAVEQGGGGLERAELAGLPVEPARVLETAAAVGRVRKGFDTLALLDAAGPGRVFLATVADCWKRAGRCEGPLGDAIRDAAWAAIHDQLAAQGAVLLKPQEMTLAGIRTPAQQARVRREYLRLLAQIEAVTGRVSGCAAGDPLRWQTARYFQAPFFHRALLEAPSFADNIPWLAAEFRQAQPLP